MIVTYNPNIEKGNVTAYGDGFRNWRDLNAGEIQVEVDIPFVHIDCTEGALHFEDGELKNNGIVIAHQI